MHACGYLYMHPVPGKLVDNFSNGRLIDWID